VNDLKSRDALARLAYRALLGARVLERKPRCEAIGSSRRSRAAIERIYVINLERHSERWDRMCYELGRLTDNSGKPVSALATRFQAVDARRTENLVEPSRVRPSYSLADQLFVDPHPLLGECFDAESWPVEMTDQEIAVALSHIAVWARIAAGDSDYSLILEDDTYFRPGCCRALDEAWSNLVWNRGHCSAFDLLYVSYKEVRTGTRFVPISGSLFKPLGGLWHLSGYVLSKPGATKLLDALPVCGPVDAWINRRFEAMQVFATRRSIIQQRPDCPSSNLYSVLPVLSQVGVLTGEKPLLPPARAGSSPIFAVGEPDSGLTALAMALSMLGYRCCSDLSDLPTSESNALFGRKRGRVFDAYVNIGSLTSGHYTELARIYPGARFIITADRDRTLPEWTSLADALRRISGSVLALKTHEPDKWATLCGFLGCAYPIDPYPTCGDRDERKLAARDRPSAIAAKKLKRDRSPWIIASERWQGICVADEATPMEEEIEQDFNGVDHGLWSLRDDTFPSNLALFTPRNVSFESDQTLRLTLRRERTPVRGFTSGALHSRQQYRYGRFVANVRPVGVPGLITGVFLHRNSPRQEIDIEFLGKDTRKMLVNVFYNPGLEGARMEYGYRGTPALIDLGFDASEEFHEYAIEWTSTAIRWSVDGSLVHERLDWDPTPIPHLPMQLHFNLWHARSRELAGRLDHADLPATSELRALHVRSRQAPGPALTSLRQIAAQAGRL
jgi:GR25 family glycosyltransferase involved in LPS biosynthesis